MSLRFLFRELWHSGSQGIVFIFCVALSLVTVVAVTSLERDVRKTISSDARQLHGGDIIVHSHYALAPELEAELGRVAEMPGTAVARSWEFYSVIRTADGTRSILANIKVVSDGYPLYGEVKLHSGRPFSAGLQPGQAMVAPGLLTRLGVNVGDRLLLGTGSLVIGDTIVRESMQPVELFTFGPRILVSEQDLKQLDLVGKGSRLQYNTMIKVPDSNYVQPVVDRLQAVADQARVETAETAGSRIKRFLDNLFFFLSIITLFTMLLAGLGMQSSLAALLRTKEQTIAVMRGLGATWGWLVRNYLGIVLILASIGWGLGLLIGFGLEKSLVELFGGILPANTRFGATLRDVGEGLVLGVLLVSFFTMVPLAAIRQVKPATVWQRAKMSEGVLQERLVLLLCGSVLLAGLVVRQLGELRFGLIFVLAVLVILWIVGYGTGWLLKFLGNRRLPLATRLAVRSLQRPGNATSIIVATLSLAFGLLLLIFLLQHNLRATYIDAYPEGAPNLFCLDIQKEQRQGFYEIAGDDASLFPVIRARLKSINGQPIDRRQELEKRGDNLSREFNLSYREELLEDEALQEGDSLFGDPMSGVPVSVLDTVAEIGSMKIGDTLLFSIQGVEIKATVVSIRSRTKSKLYPFFYFVFPPQHLSSAPQTYFAALSLPKNEIADMENRIVNRFPNISTINVANAAEELGRLMAKLVKIINFFATFAIVAGALILVSSLLATKIERVREVAYYRMLGAQKSFLGKVAVMENGILGLCAGGFALLMAQFGSWAICHYVLDISHAFAVSSSLLLLLGIVAIVIMLGVIGSYSIIGRKPGQYLRKLKM